VLAWIEKKQLPAFRLPAGHYRIYRDDFVEFLAKYSIPAHVEANKGAAKINKKAKVDDTG